MTKKTKQETYSNKFFGSVTQSAANTLTFSEITTNVDIFAKVAWVVERLEWYIDATSLTYFGFGDTAQMALTASDNIATLLLSNPSVIDLLEITIIEYGTSATCKVWEKPIVRDFSQMGGGGMIIAPRPLYVGAVSVGLSDIGTFSCRGFFRQIQLTPDEYIELVDFYRIVS
jgi:hypothetical protein